MQLKTKSPLKWAGGKFKILDEIFLMFPTTANTYYEPFFGGGSVGLNVNSKMITGNCVFGDTNSHLMDFWNSVKMNKTLFIEEINNLFTQENNTLERFKELRTEFNKTTDSFRRGVLFLYLNKHCFNGLCRLNSRGEFNVPFGFYASPVVPLKSIEKASEILSKCDLATIDFKNMFFKVKENDVVYCDPPYVELSKTSNFSSYGKDKFTEQDQKDLATCAESARDEGATVVISNHDTEFCRDIYKNADYIKKLTVSRTISGTSESRKKVNEILAIYSNNDSIKETIDSDSLIT